MKTVWNDTDIPLAYLITFRAYGTWLHGDERGSIDRFRNQYKSSIIAPNKNWHQYNEQQLKNEIVTLNSSDLFNQTATRLNEPWEIQTGVSAMFLFTDVSLLSREKHKFYF